MQMADSKDFVLIPLSLPFREDHLLACLQILGMCHLRVRITFWGQGLITAWQWNSLPGQGFSHPNMHIDKYLSKLFPMALCLPAQWQGETLECQVRDRGSKPAIWLCRGPPLSPNSHLTLTASCWIPTSWGCCEDWATVCIWKPTLQSSILFIMMTGLAIKVMLVPQRVITQQMGKEAEPSTGRPLLWLCHQRANK